MFDNYTPDTRARWLALSSFMVRMLSAEGYFTPAELKQLDEILRRHSVPETGDPAWKVDLDSANPYASPFEAAPDKQSCFADVQGWLTKREVHPPLPSFLEGRLEEVVTDGDFASARVIRPEGVALVPPDEKERVRFQKIADRWYMVFEIAQ